jgi:NADH:ubiquinone oxidoreductase subunit 3 (subunit A)
MKKIFISCLFFCIASNSYAQNKYADSLRFESANTNTSIESLSRAATQTQYPIRLLALGIITFVIIFLLLSRRHITNTKVIRFLGVIALLVVFEFLNLLLHPFGKKTNHSPVLCYLHWLYWSFVSSAALPAGKMGYA